MRFLLPLALLLTACGTPETNPVQIFVEVAPNLEAYQVEVSAQHPALEKRTEEHVTRWTYELSSPQELQPEWQITLREAGGDQRLIATKTFNPAQVAEFAKLKFDELEYLVVRYELTSSGTAIDSFTLTTIGGKPRGGTSRTMHID